MATITGFTAARMLEIENESIVDGNVVGDNLILVRRDLVEINAGSVRGPIGTPGVSQAQLDDFIENTSPVGSITDYIGTVAPPKWLVMEGQTIVGGQSLYPSLWAILPASMKSGANIIMPDTRGRMTVGLNTADSLFDLIGDTGGSKDAVVGTHFHGQITHQHTGPNHQHSGTNHTHGPGSLVANAVANHQHTINHDHPSFYTDPENAINIFAYTWNGGGAYNVNLTGGPYNPSLIDTALINHQHMIDVPNFTGWSGENGAHSHSIGGSTAADGTGMTGFSGTGLTGAGGGDNTNSAGESPVNKNLPPFITFLKIIKVE